jgi:hypothetical protein
MNVNMASTLSGMTAVSLDSIDFKSSDPNQGSLPTSPTGQPLPLLSENEKKLRVFDLLILFQMSRETKEVPHLQPPKR